MPASDDATDILPLPSPPSAEQLQRQVAQLTAAVQTNRVIGAAIGIVMERRGLDYPGAHAYLIRLSQNSNVKLAALAGDLVSGT